MPAAAAVAATAAVHIQKKITKSKTKHIIHNSIVWQQEIVTAAVCIYIFFIYYLILVAFFCAATIKIALQNASHKKKRA